MKDQLIEALAPILGTILTAAFAWAGVALAKFIQAHTKNLYLQGVLTRLDTAVQTAVLEVQQVYVDDIKSATSSGGALTDAQAAKAKADAVTAAKSYLGMKGLEQLAGVFGLGSVELDKFIGGQVEAAVQTAATSPAAPVASPVIAGQPAA